MHVTLEVMGGAGRHCAEQEDEKTAEKALERIKGGESFSKVAEEMSADPSKKSGGDIGTFSKGQVIPEFEAACETLKPGEISKVVKSPLGYHIIQLTDRQPAHQKLLAEVKEEIRQALANQQAQRQVELFVQKLRSKAQIKVRNSFAPPAASSPKEPVPAPKGPTS